MQDIYEILEKAINVSQHVQRCWDLSKELPAKDLELLASTVTNCPSKQNFAFYKVHFITNRTTIEKIHQLSTGIRNIDGELTTNSQTLANLLVVFEDLKRSPEYIAKWKKRDSSSERCWNRDQDMAVGVAAGYLNMVATTLGYRTGLCACFNKNSVKKELGCTNDVLLIIGIGYEDANKDRKTHHTTNKIIPSRKKEPIEITFDK
jgi:nitroreductase